VKNISYKLLLTLVLIISLLGTGIINAENLTAKESSPKYFTDTISSSVTIKGNKISLYPEFADRVKALDNLKKNYNSTLMLLKEEFNLGELSMENWRVYYTSNNMIDNYIEQVSDETMKESIKIGQFFDIFENSEKNDEIKSLSKQANIYENKKNILMEVNLLSKIDLLTPYHSEKLSKASNITNSVEQRVTIGINLNNAINYATNYATSPNTASYDYFSTGDCTNFVSQILEAGGVPQEVYTSEYQGWWHQTSTNWLGNTVHNYSVSFIRASTFASYMGVSYTTTRHFDFSLNVDEGDIIGYDVSSDGDWDHMAFVTDKNDYSSNYGGKSFYDYKVAQHTTNYHKWTSDSGNGWEKLEDSGYTYGIIRR